jgi:hypothetical protein
VYVVVHDEFGCLENRMSGDRWGKGTPQQMEIQTGKT